MYGRCLNLWLLLILLGVVWLGTGWADSLIVTASQANVRQGPGMSYRVLATLPSGATFPILSTQQGWYQILLDDGRKAWIASSVAQVDPGGHGLERRLDSPVGVSKRRLALVIGNAGYAVGPLKNPVNDATDMTETLRKLGFEVTLLADASQRQMEDAINSFGRQLRQGGMGLFYYAGHGLQVSGQNYLVPVGARIERESDVKYEAVSADWVLDVMEEAGNPLNLIILDACRNNPYGRGWRSPVQGLAPPRQSARGAFIAYATAPLQVAADGHGRNGIYTKHLLHYMEKPGLSVEQLFKQVRKDVARETGGKQTPWESSSLTGDFYFVSTQNGEEQQRPQPEQQQFAAEQQPLASENLRSETGRQQREEEAPKPQEAQAGREWRDPTTGMVFVYVPRGCYEMGCGSWTSECDKDEKPVHEVCVEDFWLGKYEVTQGEWRQVMGGNPSEFTRSDRHPVEGVSWEEAQDFARQISQRSGYEFGLPTEAEWEYACRGGGKERKYPWGQEEPDCQQGARNGAKFDDDERCDQTGTEAVGSYGANELGLYDMSGNVWEWVEDGYSSKAYAHNRQNHTSMREGSLRVIRGGSWDYSPRYVRCANRYQDSPGSRIDDLGFRLRRRP
jgi:formylglycine-generating enzyme required for sulfatase activity